jgi:DNA-directed RNA polymerase specialized sigma24 family protein
MTGHRASRGRDRALGGRRSSLRSPGIERSLGGGRTFTVRASSLGWPGPQCTMARRSSHEGGPLDPCVPYPTATQATFVATKFRDPTYEAQSPSLSIPDRSAARVGFVLDFDAPSSRFALAEFDKDIVRQRLRAIAGVKTGSESDADDLVANALLRVLDPEGQPWTPEQTTFIDHMTYVMRRLWDRKLRKAVNQQKILKSGIHRDQYTPSRGEAADDELHRHRSVAFWQSLLEVVLAEIGDKHPLTREICDLVARGIDEPATQARILKCDVDKVYRALETLRYHATRVLDARELAEQLKMRDRREAAAREQAEMETDAEEKDEVNL